MTQKLMNDEKKDDLYIFNQETADIKRCGNCRDLCCGIYTTRTDEHHQVQLKAISHPINRKYIFCGHTGVLKRYSDIGCSIHKQYIDRVFNP